MMSHTSYKNTGYTPVKILPFVTCSIHWWERKFHGTKVPGSESSISGTFAPGSKWSWERKVQLPFLNGGSKCRRHKDRGTAGAEGVWGAGWVLPAPPQK